MVVRIPSSQHSFSIADLEPDPPDFHIRTGNYILEVHSGVVSNMSEFFKAVCASPFKEASERIVTLHDDHPLAVMDMILAFYALSHPEIFVSDEYGPIKIEYLDEVDDVNETDMKAAYHQQKWKAGCMLYELADKYIAPKVKPLATCRIKRQAFHNFQSIVDYLGIDALLKDQHLQESMMSGAIRNSKQIPNIVRFLRNLEGEHKQIAYSTVILLTEQLGACHDTVHDMSGSLEKLRSEIVSIQKKNKENIDAFSAILLAHKGKNNGMSHGVERPLCRLFGKMMKCNADFCMLRFDPSFTDPTECPLDDPRCPCDEEKHRAT